MPCRAEAWAEQHNLTKPSLKDIIGWPSKQPWPAWAGNLYPQGLCNTVNTMRFPSANLLNICCSWALQNARAEEVPVVSSPPFPAPGQPKRHLLCLPDAMSHRSACVLWAGGAFCPARGARPLLRAGSVPAAAPIARAVSVLLEDPRVASPGRAAQALALAMSAAAGMESVRSKG